MVRHLGLRLMASVAACVVAASWTSTPAKAGFLQQLESLQLQKGATHQWRFEGGAAAQRQRDSSSIGGFSNLLSAAGPGGSGANDVNATPDDPSDDVPWSYPAGDVNNIGYEAGYDGAGVSQAYRPSRTANATSTFGAERVAQSRSGAGLYDPAFSSPALMTLEAVLKPDGYVDLAAGNQLQYVFQTRPGTPRGYYLAQQRPNSSRGLGTLTGQVSSATLGSDATRPHYVPDYASDWYYVAVTFDMSNPAGPTVVNSWYANLTTGGPLTHSVNAFNIAGTLTGLVNTAGWAGVGMFVFNLSGEAAGQEFFNGAIDNLTIYNRILSESEIGHHHLALTVVGVPEPASLFLLLLGGAAFARCRRYAA
jgi:hypothetical protein